MATDPTLAALEVKITALEQRLIDAQSRNDDRFVAQASAVKTAMEASEKAIAAAMTASEKAVLKAENASEKRFEAVNEFRGLVNDIVARLLSRAEADAKFVSLNEKIDIASSRLGRFEAMSEGKKASWDGVKTALALALGAMAFWTFFSGQKSPQTVYVPSSPGMPPVVVAPPGQGVQP